MAASKLIADIRYSRSDAENAPGQPPPRNLGKGRAKETHYWGARIARKLREREFRTGTFDHLYVNFTTASEPGTLKESTRNDPKEWYRWWDVGVDESALAKLNVQEREAFAVSETFLAISTLVTRLASRSEITPTVLVPSTTGKWRILEDRIMS